jgi:hypothetical protein
MDEPIEDHFFALLQKGVSTVCVGRAQQVGHFACVEAFAQQVMGALCINQVCHLLNCLPEVINHSGPVRVRERVGPWVIDWDPQDRDTL